MDKETFGIVTWQVIVQDQHISLDMLARVPGGEKTCSVDVPFTQFFPTYDDAYDYVADHDFFREYLDEMDDRIYKIYIVPIKVKEGAIFGVDDKGKVEKHEGE